MNRHSNITWPPLAQWVQDTSNTLGHWPPGNACREQWSVPRLPVLR